MNRCHHNSCRTRIGLAILCTALAGAAFSAWPQSPQQPGQQGWAAQQARQAWATEKLAKSPRRNEWVTIPNGSRKLKGWIDYPGVKYRDVKYHNLKAKVPVVLVLHEVFGLTDSTRNTADEIAALGYITISPDMLSGYGPSGGNPKGGNVDAFEPPLSASDALTSLNDAAVGSDLNAWADYAARLPGSNGKLAIVGLSWGGGAAFRYVAGAQRNDLKAVFVFYDVGPPPETQHFAGAPATLSLGGIQVPVYGFYGSTDTRATSSVPATREAMAAAGRFYAPVIYDGADHAFMRLGEDPGNKNLANAIACKDALERLQMLLNQIK
jgi:carboxymethylenebutenolidase